MGIDIIEGNINDSSNIAFQEKLQVNLKALEQVLLRPSFGRSSPASPALGAELEMYIIDSQGLPLTINQRLMDEALDPQLTLELNQYNIEYNLTPRALNDAPFSAIETEILQQITKLNRIAGKHKGRIIPIGILPTLKPIHFGPDFMTDRTRYKVLIDQLNKHSNYDFHIDIKGEDHLEIDMHDATLEGANTSFQIHYRVAPQFYADTFNAFQMVTPLLVAISANSPGLFGQNLWQETRIPLFKQSIDSRVKTRHQWHEPARVNFGQGWVRQSALELFREVVNLYPPLLPICSEENPLQQLAAGITPSLSELRLHQSSVWLWNRPVYDSADDGHFRIELRSLPAGPTAVDMVANAAFYIGLAEYYRDQMPLLMPALPFHLAESNFYRAAQSGLSANIVWPSATQSGCQVRPLMDVLENSVGHAKAGLLSIGIHHTEADKYLNIINARIASQQTGASWQTSKIHDNNQTFSNEASQHQMLEEYIMNSQSNKPVSLWT